MSLFFNTFKETRGLRSHICFYWYSNWPYSIRRRSNYQLQ
jgi:hypothetical protein